MAKKKPENEEDDTPGVGHNSLHAKDLKNIIERAEAIVEEKRACAEDFKELMAEAKSKGFDARTIREVIKYRAMDIETRTERQDMLDMYLNALGLL